MTIKEFACREKVMLKTVVKWIKAGYVPFASIEDNFVPDSARRPYLKARAKTAKAIYKSIIKATYNRLHVFPSIYGICEAEFNNYIDFLVAKDVICRRVTDNVTYYDLTYNGLKLFEKKGLDNALKTVMSAINSGMQIAAYLSLCA